MRRWLTKLALLTCLTANARAQPIPPAAPQPRSHILLPPQYGATVASTIIFAQASYIASVGDFLESAAIARRHNAVAAEHEMRNAVRWVSTYFERRELNRAYRLKENPPFLDKEEHRQKQYRRRIDDNAQLVIGGNVTDELNWMLRELAGMSLAYQLMPGPQSLADSPVDQKFAAGDVRHLRLTDGGKVGGQMLVFRADAAEITATRWPRALRPREFEESRRAFEDARKSAALEIGRKGQLSLEKEEALMNAVDKLSAVFNSVYPPKQNASSPSKFLVYLGGKRYLQSLAASVLRLIETNDARVFDGSYVFEGDSVVDLVQHMCRYGLEFAPPEPGDEATYRKLFFAMRGVYRSTAPEAEAMN
jgi:hypothetical protein